MKVSKIIIERCEGKSVECIKLECSSYEEANRILLNWSFTAPKGGGYDKCDFQVIFEDGDDYRGRYDLKHYTDREISLKQHMIDVVSYYANQGEQESID